jgi:hypothetical protein
MNLDTQHVIDELDSAERVRPKSRSAAPGARSPILMYTFGARRASCRSGRSAENRSDKGSRRPDSNRGPLHYEMAAAFAAGCV